MHDKHEINLVREDGQYYLTGHLNYKNVSSLLQDSIQQFKQNPPVEINFSRLSSANSAVVALLVEWLKFAKKAGHTIQFKSLPEDVDSIIRAAGMSELIQSGS